MLFSSFFLSFCTCFYLSAPISFSFYVLFRVSLVSTFLLFFILLKISSFTFSVRIALLSVLLKMLPFASPKNAQSRNEINRDAKWIFGGRGKKAEREREKKREAAAREGKGPKFQCDQRQGAQAFHFHKLYTFKNCL